MYCLKKLNFIGLFGSSGNFNRENPTSFIDPAGETALFIRFDFTFCSVTYVCFVSFNLLWGIYLSRVKT